jgi:broad specificity phosphatase PhoE
MDLHPCLDLDLAPVWQTTELNHFKGSFVEIVIIRHGKSAVDTSGKVSASEFGSCIQDYDMAGIDNNNRPPVEVIEKAKSCNFCVCSSLARSLHSAKLLEIEKPDFVSPLFRECEMPYNNWKLPTLSKSVWPIVYRILQISGYSPNAESYKEIKSRSKECAIQLINLARAHDSVLYVGHGALGWVLHKHLLSMGWLGPKKSVREHWECGVYKYNET